MYLKRIAAVLLSLALLFTFVPVAAFADGGGDSTGYTVYESTSADGTYTPIAGGVLELALGETKYLKFFDGTNYVTDYSAVSISEYSTIALTIDTDQSGYIVVAADDENTTYRSVTFTLNGIPVTFDISVYSTTPPGGGGQGDMPPVGFYYVDGEGNSWLQSSVYITNYGQNRLIIKDGAGNEVTLPKENVTFTTQDGQVTDKISCEINGSEIKFKADSNATAGRYKVVVTYNGETATYDVDVHTVKLQYATPVDSGDLVWNTAQVMGMSPTIYLDVSQSGRTLYLRTLVDEVVPDHSTTLAGGGTEEVLLENKSVNTTASFTVKNKTAGYIEIEVAESNGSLQISTTYKRSDTPSTPSLWASLVVAGVQVPGDPESSYKDAVVKEVTANTGKVEIADVTGEPSEADAGFSVENGKLYFDTTNKTAGNYDAVVGDKTYVAVIFTSKIVDLVERPIAVKDFTVTLDQLKSSGGSGYNYASYNSYGFSVSPCAQYSWTPYFVMENGIATYYPMYIYKKDNSGNVLSMANELVVSGGDQKDYWTVTEVNLDGTVVWKVEPVVEKMNKSCGSLGNIYIINDTDILIQQIAGMGVGDTSEYNLGKYGFTMDETMVDTDQFWDLGNYTSLYAYATAGQEYTPFTFYLVKFTGQPLDAEYVLYDEIDISTLKVQTTDGDFVDVDFVTHTSDGRNAIGIKVDLPDTSVEQCEELRVSFRLKNDSGDPPTTYFSFGGLTCGPKHAETSEVVVDNVADLLYHYRTATGNTTIYLEEGTYSFDFVHSRNDVHVLPVEGAEVIFNGAENSTEPIVKLTAPNMPGRFEHVIIDGRNGTRDGLVSTGNTFATNMVIRNCNIGVQARGFGAYYANNSVFESNKIAVIAGAVAGYASITDNVFDGNDVAILHQAHSQTARIKNNIFVDNTTDLQTEITDKISATQNYFDRCVDGGAPAIVGQVYSTQAAVTPTVYYAPYYTDTAKTTLSADLAGAEPQSGSTAGYTLPVDLTVNGATTFDSGLFEEMKAADSAVSVEIPVSENTATAGAMPDVKVTTVWGFDNSEGSLAAELPANMDLKVSDVPSEAAGQIVADTVENIDDIVQYVNFAHDGNLPGTATVKILASDVSDAEELKLYYINETTGEVEEAEICAVETVVIDGETYYVVTVKHCSEYIITTNVVVKEPAPDDGGDNDDPTDPPSGDDDPTDPPSGDDDPTDPPSGDDDPTDPPSGDNDPTDPPSGDNDPTDPPSGNSNPTPPLAGGSTDTSGSSSSAVQTPPAASATTTANDFVSAVEVSNKLENANTDEVIISVEDKSHVSPKAFELLAEHPDKTLVFDGENYSIRFAGKDLTDPTVLGSNAFNAKVSFESPNAAAIQIVAGDAELFHIYFNHHGQLPGKATVRVFAGTDNAGLEKHVHYFDGTDNNFEYISTVTVDADGWVEFVIEHCSDYVLSDVILDATVNADAEEPAAEPEEPADQTAPEQDTPADEPADEPVNTPADQTVTEPEQNSAPVLPIVVIALIACAVIVAVILVLKKKAAN